MLISHDHNFLFVHVPKNAGGSIQSTLRPWAASPEKLLLNVCLEKVGIRCNYFGPYRWRRFRNHATAEQACRHLPARVFDGLFKFAFVRNPWDRLVSQYHYILATPSHHRHHFVKKLSFDEFVDFWTARGKAGQREFVTDRAGKLLVDFVGRYERLAADFRHVCEVLKLNVQLPHVHRSSRGDFREYYSRQLATLVQDRLRADLDLFDYSYDHVARAAA